MPSSPAYRRRIRSDALNALAANQGPLRMKARAAHQEIHIDDHAALVAGPPLSGVPETITPLRG